MKQALAATKVLSAFLVMISVGQQCRAEEAQDQTSVAVEILKQAFNCPGKIDHWQVGDVSVSNLVVSEYLGNAQTFSVLQTHTNMQMHPGHNADRQVKFNIETANFSDLLSAILLQPFSNSAGWNIQYKCRSGLNCIDTKFWGDDDLFFVPREKLRRGEMPYGNATACDRQTAEDIRAAMGTLIELNKSK